MIKILLAILVFCFMSCTADNTCAHKEANPRFLNKILCKEDFKILQGAPLSNKYSNVATVKVVYCIREKRLYFINSYFYKFHYEFCQRKVLKYTNLADFNNIEYSSSSLREFGLANINFFASSKKYVLEMFADDQMPDSLLGLIYRKVSANLLFKDNLYVFVNSETMRQRIPFLNSKGIKMISPNEIYEGQTFQAMYKGKAYGYLRFVSGDQLKAFDISENDILVCDGLPNEFPLCRAIITSTYQTPLCHVNVLSSNRGTPNATYRYVFRDSVFLKLKDSLVCLEVTDQAVKVKKARRYEAKEYWGVKRDNKLVKIHFDTITSGLIDARKLRSKDVRAYGGKASNFGELTQIVVDAKPLPVPEGAFAIPFYYYNRHVRSNGIQVFIDSILKNRKEIEAKGELGMALKQIREKIKQAKFDPLLRDLVVRKMTEFKVGKSFRFRSSTNAEDIAGFNGAGLYTSKTGTLDDKDKNIEKAIKSVWASLWSLRAFQEREYFGIDQNKVYMGVLCHRSFGDEDANGVVVTKNLYRENYPGMVVNVQKGETSVVLPNDSIRCEQILLTDPIDDLGELGIDHISYSSLSPSKSILAKDEVLLLHKYCSAIKSHFVKIKLRVSDYYSILKYGVDIEFKLDASTRKLYIKQAREY